MNKYRQSLDNISSIDLDRVLEKLGYEEADRISVYGACDYPNNEMTYDIENLLELVNKEEVLEKRCSVLEKALDKACSLLALTYGTPLNKDDVVVYTCKTPLIILDNSKEKWKEKILEEVQDGESKK